jgi:hypothetical protein
MCGNLWITPAENDKPSTNTGVFYPQIKELIHRNVRVIHKSVDKNG